MKIKLCGMRRQEDISYVNEFVPDYAGFILSGGFRRSIDSDTFRNLVSSMRSDIKRVGVFVNEPPENILKNYAELLDVIQLHGDENEKYVQTLRQSCSCEIWKAVRARSSADIETAASTGCNKLLIDSYVKGKVGGTGQKADLKIIKKARISLPFFLAGGLNAENIEESLKSVKPYGADLSGGIETDGFKDREKIREIINIVRSADLE
ncbi:MAG: phosphoribosylanthranilate isomerase [Porcipelethomonas sp.]